jgi:hypothetical protein
MYGCSTSEFSGGLNHRHHNVFLGGGRERIDQSTFKKYAGRELFPEKGSGFFDMVFNGNCTACSVANQVCSCISWLKRKFNFSRKIHSME